MVVPRSVTELREVIADAGRHRLRVRAVGSGHSFNGAAVAPDVLLDLRRLDKVVAVDAARRQVTVQAGVPLARLNTLLAREHLALENLGDIDKQTLSGAVATGTHGTGARFRGMAAQVLALDLVLADGSTLACSPELDRDLFDAARISLGALGVISRITLQCVPAFRVHAVERPAGLDETLSGLDDWIAAHDHTEFYWFPHTDRVLTKTDDRLPADAEDPAPALPWWRQVVDDEVLSNAVFGVTNALCTVAPAITPHVNAVASRALTAREYVDSSYRVFCSPRRVRFAESEYAIPRTSVADVLTELRRWVESHDVRIPFPVEVRFAAADDIWLSTAYHRETAYIAVHQYHRMPRDPYFEAFEAIAAEVDGRPHWGKLHSLAARDLGRLYPRFADFVAIRGRLDPDRRFSNAYLSQVFGV
jgi:L-gulonolactone oxidase